MPPAGFEPAISAGERPQSYALDRAATGIGLEKKTLLNNGFDFLSNFSVKHFSLQEDLKQIWP